MRYAMQHDIYQPTPTTLCGWSGSVSSLVASLNTAAVGGFTPKAERAKDSGGQ